MICDLVHSLGREIFVAQEQRAEVKLWNPSAFCTGPNGKDTGNHLAAVGYGRGEALGSIF